MVGMKYGHVIVAILIILFLPVKFSSNIWKEAACLKISRGQAVHYIYHETQTNLREDEMSTTVEEWSQAVLEGLATKTGKTITNTGDNLTAMEIWAEFEGGGFKNTAKNNVLNTTYEGPGAYMDECLLAYGTLVQGINATVETLVQPAYVAIVDSLEKSQLVADTLMAIQVSPWSGSRYYGQLATANLVEGIPATVVSEDTLPSVVTAPAETKPTVSSTGPTESGSPKVPVILMINGKTVFSQDLEI
jgi:hypothetical protein